MLSYHFAMRKNGTGQVEGLGFMVLADDSEALAFAEQVIRDLMNEDRNYASWTMDITDGERPVGSVPID
jgi:Domain of unknown function (DUF6894)